MSNTTIIEFQNLDREIEALKPFLTIDQNYGSKSIGVDHPLSMMLEKLHRKKYDYGPVQSTESLINPDFWQLNQTQLFNQLDNKFKNILMNILSTYTMTYIYFIEKSGLNLCSKMILLSKTKEEKLFYALMGADESKHLIGISRFLSTNEIDQRYKGHQIFKLFSDVIQIGSPAVIVLIMQVFLEGFGIQHYGEILKNTHNENFQSYLKSVLADEAYHFGGGKIVYQTKVMTKEDIKFSVKILHDILNIFKLGEVEVILNVLKELNIANLETIKIFIDELTPELTSAKFTLALEELTKGTHPEVYQSLKDLNAFEPAPREKFWLMAEEIFH